jgi:hypothetical protein
MLLFPGFSALRTTLGLVGKTFGRKKPLLLGSKGEDRTTNGTLDRLVLKTHWMTSLFQYLVRVGHPILGMNR